MQHRDTEIQRKIKTLYFCFDIVIRGFAEGTDARE